MYPSLPVIAIDAMGGDHAPYEIVKGGIQAALKFSCEIILVGDVEKIFDEIKNKLSRELNFNYITEKISDVDTEIKINQGSKRITIKLIHAPDEVKMDEKNPARAVKRAENSSIVVANKLVASGKADAVIAAGNTGAATVASLFELKRIEGFSKPCICTIIPTLHSKMLLIDGGANIETKTQEIVQSAILGTLFHKIVFKSQNPRVGLLNVGEEEGKGIELYKQTYELLKQEAKINFVGNVEGKTIIDGSLCEIAVCDGFTGNIHLKAFEGGLKLMSNKMQYEIKSGGFLNMLAGLVLKSTGVFTRLKNHFDPNSYGGALLGGVNGVSIISHGSSNYEAIVSACKHAILFIEEDLINKLKAEISVTEPLQA